MADGDRSCEKMAAFTAEAPRRRERAFVFKPLRLRDSAVRRVFGDYFTASTAVGTQFLLALQPASAGGRVAHSGQIFTELFT